MRAAKKFCITGENVSQVASASEKLKGALFRSLSPYPGFSSKAGSSLTFPAGAHCSIHSRATLQAAQMSAHVHKRLLNGPLQRPLLPGPGCSGSGKELLGSFGR